MSRRPLPLFHFFAYAILIVGALLMIVPFYWMVTTSLKSMGEVFVYPPKLIPSPILLDNYSKAWTALPFGMAYLNSFKICISVTLGTILTSSMAGYAFARMDFIGNKLFFMLILATMMIPAQVTLVPMYLLFDQIHWIDTHWPLIIPPILCNAFGVFLLRQFMMSIPRDLEDAAKVDGYNPWQIYWRIMLPNCGPAIAALSIFTFVANWNSFLGPLIYLSTPSKATIPLLIASFKGLYFTNWPLLMAAASISLIPVIIVYLFAQRYFIEGITLSGLKG